MRETNILALLGMILSIFSITICCPIEMSSYGVLLPVGMLLAIAGGICSLLGYLASRKEKFEQPFTYLAIAGMIIGGVALILKLVIGIIILIGGISLFSMPH